MVRVDRFPVNGLQAQIAENGPNNVFQVCSLVYGGSLRKVPGWAGVVWGYDGEMHGIGLEARKRLLNILVGYVSVLGRILNARIGNISAQESL